MLRRTFLGALTAGLTSFFGFLGFKKKPAPEGYAFLIDTDYCLYTYHKGRREEGGLSPPMESVYDHGEPPYVVIPDVRVKTYHSAHGDINYVEKPVRTTTGIMDCIRTNSPWPYGSELTEKQLEEWLRIAMEYKKTAPLTVLEKAIKKRS